MIGKCECGEGICVNMGNLVKNPYCPHYPSAPSEHFDCGTPITDPRTPCVKGKPTIGGDNPFCDVHSEYVKTCFWCNTTASSEEDPRDAQIRSLKDELEEKPDFECDVCGSEYSVDDGAICQNCWTDDARARRGKVLTRKTEKVEGLQEELNGIKAQLVGLVEGIKLIASHPETARHDGKIRLSGQVQIEMVDMAYGLLSNLPESIKGKVLVDEMVWGVAIEQNKHVHTVAKENKTLGDDNQKLGEALEPFARWEKWVREESEDGKATLTINEGKLAGKFLFATDFSRAKAALEAKWISHEPR